MIFHQRPCCLTFPLMKTILAFTLLAAGLLLSAPLGSAEDHHRRQSYHQYNSRSSYGGGHGNTGGGHRSQSYPSYSVPRESHGAYSRGYSGYQGYGSSGGHGARSSSHLRNRGISISVFGH